MSRSTLVLLAVLAIAPNATRAGNCDRDRATLKGLTAVSVVVDNLHDQLQAAGITPSVVRARIEDRLRSASIVVDQSKNDFVAVRMNGVRDKRGPFALAVTLGAYQPVILSRDPKVRTATQTWEVETVLLAEPKQLYRAAMETVDELTDSFVDAYRSVNK
jgi:hypothetical protein